MNSSCAAEIDMPKFKGEITFGPVTILIDTDFIRARRYSQDKIFEIEGTQFDYDEVFTNKKRILYWDSRHKTNTSSGKLCDYHTKECLKPIGFHRYD